MEAIQKVQKVKVPRIQTKTDASGILHVKHKYTMKSASYYINLLKQYRERNAARLGIQRIGIFGSVARGEQNNNSDLDIFVDIKEPDYFILCNIHDDLDPLCGCKVDLVHLHKFLRPLFLKNIEKDAIMA